MDKVGAMRVWWIPQIPMKAFYADVESVKEAAKLMIVLAEYDNFQFENNIKPDYYNDGGLQVYEADAGEGEPGWIDWHDDETGEDDPVAYMREIGEIE